MTMPGDIFNTFLTNVGTISGPNQRSIVGLNERDAAADLKVLLAIARCAANGESVPVSRLYSESDMPISSLGRSVDHLARANLIQISQQGREEYINITEAGKVLLSYAESSQRP
jgi:predicted transcriptional regulator